VRRSRLSLASLVLVAGCGAAGEPAATPSVVIPAASFRLENAPIPVQLEVLGDGPAQITYGPPAARLTAATPWTTTIDSSPSDVVLATTLTARTTSTSADATITCRITVGRTTLLERTGRGPHAIADCSPLVTAP